MIDVLLVAGAVMLVVQQIWLDSLAVRAKPWSYAGPISLVEQRFRASHGDLHRIDVWAFVEGTREAEIFARLTPEGSDTPIRESRAVVEGRRFSDATVAFHICAHSPQPWEDLHACRWCPQGARLRVPGAQQHRPYP